jgi:Methane oxygenase PmoA
MKIPFNHTIRLLIASTLAAGMGALGAEERLEFHQGGQLRFAWQKAPLANPQGGEKFKASAFIHPLSTPGGFPCTTLQPSDHLHHLGIWWPWKFIEVDGKKFNTWEIQEGQGAHVARSVKTLSNKPGQAQWELTNETIFKPKDAAPVVAIHETTQIALSSNSDATILDIAIQQKAAGSPVTISAYRYSGFSWRGPATWNKDNSTMTTSGGKNREDANGTPARWVVVSGPTPMGTASLLILSAAEKNTGTPEKIRVWNATAHNGTPFVNFNPVMDKPLPLDDAHPSVSKRSYRVIAADRMIDAAAAEASWREWTGQ